MTFVQENFTTLKSDLRSLAVKIHKILDAYTKFENVFSDKLAQTVPKNSP